MSSSLLTPVLQLLMGILTILPSSRSCKGGGAKEDTGVHGTEVLVFTLATLLASFPPTPCVNLGMDNGV